MSTIRSIYLRALRRGLHNLDHLRNRVADVLNKTDRHTKANDGLKLNVVSHVNDATGQAQVYNAFDDPDFRKKVDEMYRRALADNSHLVSSQLYRFPIGQCVDPSSLNQFAVRQLNAHRLREGGGE